MEEVGIIRICWVKRACVALEPLIFAWLVDHGSGSVSGSTVVIRISGGLHDTDFSVLALELALLEHAVLFTEGAVILVGAFLALVGTIHAAFAASIFKEVALLALGAGPVVQVVLASAEEATTIS